MASAWPSAPPAAAGCASAAPPSAVRGARARGARRASRRELFRAELPNRVQRARRKISRPLLRALTGGLHGKGTYTFANGDKYDGQHKDGKKHGKGTLTWTDGGKYVGEYKDDVPHGFGTQLFANGTIEYQGEWENGYPVDHGN